MKLVDTGITLGELRSLAEGRFGDPVKALVDARREIIMVDADLHSDEEAWLPENGSAQADLQGINLHPRYLPEDWIEFDSLINIRPSQGNRSRGGDDPEVRDRIMAIVDSLVQQ
jgi:hypothetical protein